MFQNKEIKVVIDRCGRPTISTEGFTGESCLAATKNLEKVLGNTGEVDREFGPEYYQTSNDNTEHEKLVW
jgi:hypothetical protein